MAANRKRDSKKQGCRNHGYMNTWNEWSDWNIAVLIKTGLETGPAVGTGTNHRFLKNTLHKRNRFAHDASREAG